MYSARQLNMLAPFTKRKLTTEIWSKTWMYLNHYGNKENTNYDMCNLSIKGHYFRAKINVKNREKSLTIHNKPLK